MKNNKKLLWIGDLKLPDKTKVTRKELADIYNMEMDEPVPEDNKHIPEKETNSDFETFTVAFDKKQEDDDTK